MNTTKQLQELLSTMRRAIGTHNMIQDGDRVAVGLSGGKDSLVLLGCLAVYQKFSPQKFDLIAVTVDGAMGQKFDRLKRFCKKLGVTYHIEPSQIGPIVFETRKEKNPCSLCAKLRRGILNSALNKLGYNKLALAHHVDDMAETFFLSLLYEGRLNTFSPVAYMSRSDITVIRPMILTEEKDIVSYAKSAKLPILKNPCPVNHKTKREDMKKLIKRFDKEIIGGRINILGALTNPDRNNLWK